MGNLIDLSTRINKVYKESLDCEDKTAVSKRLLGLVKCEQNLIDELELTREKYIEIRDLFVKAYDLKLENNLLFGFSRNIQERYDYYRVLAKLNERVKTTEPVNYDEADTLYRDTFVAVLYNSLLDDAKEHSEASMVLTECATRILMDSTPTEISILENGLMPLESINCGVRASIEKFLMHKMVTYKDGQDISIVDFSLGEFLYKQYLTYRSEIFSEQENYIDSNSIEDAMDGMNLAYMNYILSLIALMSSKDRQKTYNSFLKQDGNEDKSFQEMLDYMLKRVSYLEKDLIPRISHASIAKECSY